MNKCKHTLRNNPEERKSYNFVLSSVIIRNQNICLFSLFVFSLPAEQSASHSVSQSFCQSIILSVSHSFSQLVNHSVSKSFCLSVIQSVSYSVSQSFSQSRNKLTFKKLVQERFLVRFGFYGRNIFPPT